MAITRRSTPKFLLTQYTEVTIKRFPPGKFVKGKWVQSEPFNLIIEANVQPVQFKEIQMMPEADRTKEWIKLYSRDEIRTAREGDNGWDADVVLWDGYEYKVMKAKKYVMGVLDHSFIYAARTPISALPI